MHSAGENRLADGISEVEPQTAQRLQLSQEESALRYLSFAEQQAGIVEGLNKTTAKPVQKMGVVGGGTMGQGIASAALGAGLSVTLAERNESSLQAAVSRTTQKNEALAAKGRITSDEAAARNARLHGTVDMDGLSDCDLVIEAVFEDMDVKRAVLAELESVLAPEAIMATNTSYLDINAMAVGLVRPERVLGLHFFSPADRMPLLEVVRAQRTADGTLATGLALAVKLNKQPVVAQVSEGFIGNRIYSAYRRCAELLVLDGATPQAIDQAVREFGYAMGPFEVSDLSGLDIAWAMRKRLAATRNPEDRYVIIPDRLCEAGRLGRKTGRGWYDYSIGKAQPDPEVGEIIAAARKEAGITVRNYDAKTIQRQLIAAVVNEAALVVNEGVARRASDIDVTLVNGFGFPRWRGGPLYWAAQQDPARLRADLAILAETIGHGFRHGPVQIVLNQISNNTGAA